MANNNGTMLPFTNDFIFSMVMQNPDITRTWILTTLTPANLIEH